MAGKKEVERGPRGPFGRPAPLPEEIPGTDFPEDTDIIDTSVEGQAQDEAEQAAQLPVAPAAPSAPATAAPSLPEPSGATPIRGTFSVPGSRGARPFVTSQSGQERTIGARIAPFLARDARRFRQPGASPGVGPETFGDLFGSAAFANDLSRALSRRSRMMEK